MRLQMLVAALGQDVTTLAERMNLECDAIVINQCNENAYQEYTRDEAQIKCYSFAERGVGLSRNNALLRADREISLFADEDIVYDEGYVKLVLQEFDEHPEADMLLFNVRVCEERRTYYTETFGKVSLHNCGRYPAYSFAVRTEKMHNANLTYSLLFGGGAKYSNGEDSLFIRDCIKAGLRVYKTPVEIGEEHPRESTWFHGYDRKFFFDRGVLYHYLYGKLAKPIALRFLLKHQDIMCQEIPVKKAYRIMAKGIIEAKK
ncbi:MAG: glycosyltransferase family A protein [Lachnospiraceae bacterium]|nr:glycosyltransferase family A protein [Lachnospiraceae bacterium]